MGFVEFVSDRWPVLSFLAYQHMSLVVQTLILATVIAVAIGVLIYRSRSAWPSGTAVTAVGLTIPSYALLGVLVGIVGARRCALGHPAGVLRRASRSCATSWSA